jgi:hypothetical protein
MSKSLSELLKEKDLIEERLRSIPFSYSGVLQFCGAEVLTFRRFGTCQGTWIAKVRYKSETFWLRGNFGSCSGCDTLYGVLEQFQDNYYNWHCYQLFDEIEEDSEESLKLFIEAADEHFNRLLDFGRNLLEDQKT